MTTRPHTFQSLQWEPLAPTPETRAGADVMLSCQSPTSAMCLRIDAHHGRAAALQNEDVGQANTLDKSKRR